MVKVYIFVVLVAFAALFFAGATAADGDSSGNLIPSILNSGGDALKDAVERVAGALSIFGVATEQIQDIKIILEKLVEAVIQILQAFSSTSPS